MGTDKTRRQRIIDLLQERSWSVYDLAEMFEVKVSTILDDLEHIKRSISSHYRIQILPPECNNCGFKFKKRTRLTKPSRCPRCKGERISPPMVRVELG